ncbi:hypothetical protein HK097_009318 [Rhizophlyctis rosea]|uniref:Uncharacterized protein n=1 Tax=Rhizophlyctis rosea TaxID=64517 RepID=A0AAD5SBG3_9FUNG|nr:hypothetical protein HK097_009318 [Rhizophlyctis rosea]
MGKSAPTSPSTSTNIPPRPRTNGLRSLFPPPPKRKNPLDQLQDLLNELQAAGTQTGQPSKPPPPFSPVWTSPSENPLVVPRPASSTEPGLTSGVVKQEIEDALKPFTIQSVRNDVGSVEVGVEGQDGEGRLKGIFTDIGSLEVGEEGQDGAGRLKGILTADEPDYTVIKPEKEIVPPRLAHGLEKVLFTPGIHHLKDPDTGQYNFDPYLQDIMQPEDFDFDTLPPYITASQDETLHNLTKKHSCTYFASTSSITSILSRIYLVVSNFKDVNTTGFSKEFELEPTQLTAIHREPTAIMVRYMDGVYGIDMEKAEREEMIMMKLGQSMERMLTETPEEFGKREKGAVEKVVGGGGSSRENECFHHAKIGKFLMRAQIDCWHPELRNKTFDLKTRSTVAVRMSPQKYAELTSYKLIKLNGLFESFEREYYDMLRSAFLKYSFQARIGNMDGIFVTYHNTQQIFGFQYVPLVEIDQKLFGSVQHAEESFTISLQILQRILDEARTRLGPKRSFRVLCEVGGKNQQSVNFYMEALDPVPTWAEKVGVDLVRVNVKLTPDVMGAWKGVMGGFRVGESGKEKRRRTSVYRFEYAMTVTEGEAARKGYNEVQSLMTKGWEKKRNDKFVDMIMSKVGKNGRGGGAGGKEFVGNWRSGREEEFAVAY